MVNVVDGLSQLKYKAEIDFQANVDRRDNKDRSSVELFAGMLSSRFVLLQILSAVTLTGLDNF